MTEAATDRPYHHGNLRSALIAAGLRLLETGEPVTLRAVAKAVGVSHTAPYNHFSGKEALLAAIAAEGFHRLRAAIETARADAGADCGDQLYAAGLAYILFAAERPALFRLMFGPREDKPSTTEAGQAAFGSLVAVIEEGMATGVFRGEDPLPAAFTAWALVHGMAQLALDRSGPLTPEDRDGIRRRLRAGHKIMLDGLRAAPGA